MSSGWCPTIRRASNRGAVTFGSMGAQTTAQLPAGRGDADLAALGAVLADRARVRILLALGDGRALAASVLAAEAGVSTSTASSHLARLVDAGLLVVTARGRYRYYRLAGPSVGELIETLARLCPTAPVRSLREGTRAHAVRRARTCYDHLAGRLGVDLTAALISSGLLTVAEPAELDVGPGPASRPGELTAGGGPGSPHWASPCPARTSCVAARTGPSSGRISPDHMGTPCCLGCWSGIGCVTRREAGLSG